MSRSQDGTTSAQGSDISVEVLHQRLQAGIDAIESGDDWRAWLDFAQRLHQYSFNNLILIWSQRPDATSIASYRTWQSVHRQVRRGERALRVLAPILRRTPVLDADGRVVLDAKGQPRRQQQVVGFRPAAVFDISQTEGPPVASPTPATLLTGSAPNGLWDALSREIAERGYRLLRAGADQLDGANGVTEVVQREVWVRDDVDDAQAVKTLAHELAHVVLHAASDDGSPPVACAGIREVEAESVAHLVLAAHGLTTDGYSFPYVASWAYPLAAVEHVAMSEIVSRTGTRVMNTARDLINATTTPDVTSSPASGALVARVVEGARRTKELRERVAGSDLPRADRAVLLGVLADSHDYLRRSVRSSWVPEYLKTRGLVTALDTHEMGHAPKQWTTLTDHLRSLGYTDEHIEASGMAVRAQNGHLIDHFRDRLTIPLRNTDHEIVGFTARVSPDRAGRREAPKYLNTRATTVFRKGELLYGLSEHLDHLQAGRVPVLCEGPLDAIAIDHLAVGTNLPVVGLASIGTAFTQEQGRQLGAAVGERSICLAFDADAAGMAATEKAWRALTDHGPRSVVAAVLPAGSDPASLLVSAPDVLSRAVRDARPAALVLAEQKVADARLDGNAGRELMAFRDLTELAERVPPAERSAYLLRVADLLHIEVGLAAAEVGERHPQLLQERALRPRTEGCAAVAARLREEPSDGPMQRHVFTASDAGSVSRISQS